MPVLFKQGSVVLYIWTDEGKPTEPIHIHIAYKRQSSNSDKFWLSKYGYFAPDRHNNVIKGRAAEQIISAFINTGGVEHLLSKWEAQFGKDAVRFFDE